MSAHLDCLAQARHALLSADADACADAIAAFESLYTGESPDEATLLACRAQLRSLAAIAGAAAEGVAAARMGLADALAAAGRLTTYDSAGGRESRMTRATVARRF